MRLYRIGPERYLDVYTGMGASYRDGARWNAQGIPVLYFAASPSVAMLEMGNYLASPRHVPRSYRLGIYELPDESIDIWKIDTLPDDWASFPYPSSTQALGSEWLRAAGNFILLVPSCAVAGGLENIAVVNPSHPDVREIRLVDTHEVIFNPRAFRDT